MKHVLRRLRIIAYKLRGKRRNTARYVLNINHALFNSKLCGNGFKTVVFRAPVLKAYIILAYRRFRGGGTDGFGRVEIKQEVFRAFVVAVYETAVAKRQLGIFVAVKSGLAVGGRGYFRFVYRNRARPHFRALLRREIKYCFFRQLYVFPVMIRHIENIAV